MPSTSPRAARPPRAVSDADTVEALYRAHRDDVWRYAVRRCRDADEAADLVADVFVRALGGVHRFDPGRGRPVAWLLGIAHHLLVDGHRRPGARRLPLARCRDVTCCPTMNVRPWRPASTPSGGPAP